MLATCPRPAPIRGRIRGSIVVRPSRFGLAELQATRRHVEVRVDLAQDAHPDGAEAQGGALRYESRAGGGSLFTLELPALVAEATERRAPHAILTYAIRVADDFHRFYHEHRVLESSQEAFRLGLCRATATVIARCLDLVGVEAPERM